MINLGGGAAGNGRLACFEPASIDEYERRRDEFRARRDFIVPALNRLGLTVPVMPDGAFYAWAFGYSPERQGGIIVTKKWRTSRTWKSFNWRNS